MKMRETEDTTVMVIKRMENSLSSMEQMAYESINITDRLLVLISNAREYAVSMDTASIEEREKAYKAIGGILDQLLETAFQVNNVAHDLEKESSYQRGTTEKIGQIIELLYAMTDEMER